jgi:non-heme chloroperoxidase
MKPFQLFLSVFLVAVLASLAAADQPSKRLPSNAQTALPKVQRMKLRTGVSLEYVEQGSSSGTPVILLHGLSDSWRSYEMVLPHLPNSIRAFSISQRGHGNSDRPVRGYLPRDFAADVAAFMDAKEISRAVIVGHSMGSYVAQRFAIDYPDRTAGLMVVGSFDSLKNNAGVDQLRKELASLKDPLDRAWVKAFQVSTSAQSVPEPMMESYVNESMKVPIRVWRASLDGLLDGDHSHLLNKIGSPTWIVMGEKDEFFPRTVQESLARQITNSKLLSYPNAGHAIHWEEPQRFAADLAKFVQQINNAPKS